MFQNPFITLNKQFCRGIRKVANFLIVFAVLESTHEQIEKKKFA